MPERVAAYFAGNEQRGPQFYVKVGSKLDRLKQQPFAVAFRFVPVARIVKADQEGKVKKK